MQVLSEEDKGRLFNEFIGLIEQAVLERIPEKAVLEETEALKNYRGAAYCVKCSALFHDLNGMEMLKAWRQHSASCNSDLASHNDSL